MSVNDQLAQKIEEKKIIFIPWDRKVRETGIGIYFEDEFQGTKYRKRVGGVNYRVSTGETEPLIETKDPKEKEIVKELIEVISEKLKTDKNANISLKSLERKTNP